MLRQQQRYRRIKDTTLATKRVEAKRKAGMAEIQEDVIETVVVRKRWRRGLVVARMESRCPRDTGVCWVPSFDRVDVVPTLPSRDDHLAGAKCRWATFVPRG